MLRMADDRVAQGALRTLGVVADGLVANHGWSNEAWIGDEVVVRISPGRLTGSFAHEARVTPLVGAAGIPVPEVLGHGLVRDLGFEAAGEWIVSRRVQGITMAAAWPSLGAGERRQVGNELGTILSQLNSLEATIGAPRWLIESGDNLHNAYRKPTLVFAIIDAAASLPGAVSSIVAEARNFVAARYESVTAEPDVVIHGDAHGHNVMVENGHVVALLDWEGAHHGPATIELDMLLRYWANADDFPSFPGGPPTGIGPGGGLDAVDYIAETYPALFARPTLRAQLEFYDAYWQVHALLVARHFDDAPDWQRVQRVLDGDTHLCLFERFF
ncbi:MAG: hypothetical protein QOI61_2438 [Actinomycetota bacterium]|jgi:aminoglycoside phosphotransferase (APT) family kinase protein